MAERNLSANNRNTILAACRDLVLRDTPLPSSSIAAPLLQRRRSRSEAAREPVVAWLPVTVSQNRLAAVIGKAKESAIFGPNRLWQSKNEFEDDLRVTLVDASFRDDGISFPRPLAGSVSASTSVEERQRLLSDLVRVSSAEFMAGLFVSQTFLVGMSARSGIAATASERERARTGEPSRLWRAVTERIRGSREHYFAGYSRIAAVFGLEPRDDTTIETALGVFTAIAAATADGLGPAAVYDRQNGAPALVINGVHWTYLGFLIATLMNDLFVIEGERPIPALSGVRRIVVTSDASSQSTLA